MVIFWFGHFFLSIIISNSSLFNVQPCPAHFSAAAVIIICFVSMKHARAQNLRHGWLQPTTFELMFWKEIREMKKASIIFEMGQMLRFVTNHFCFRFIVHGMPETFFFLLLKFLFTFFLNFLECRKCLKLAFEICLWLSILSLFQHFSPNQKF